MLNPFTVLPCLCDGLLLFLIVSCNPYRQLYLLFRMRFRIQFRDAAIKNITPTHFKERCHFLIVVVGKITQQEVLTFLVEDNLNSVGIIRILKLTFKANRLTDFEVIPNKVCIVILAACEMAVHEIKVVCFHFVTFLRVKHHFTLQK